MFTGIIEELGTVASFERLSGGARLSVRGREILSDLEIGGSIAVNGVCLTAVGVDGSGFRADLSPETLDRSNLGLLQAGHRVNLERPLLPTSRLSGHFVQGHVDGVGALVSLESLPDGNWWLRVRVPEDLLHFLVFKGSIAIDGISLTVASLESDVVGAAIIPHTYEMTNLSGLGPGSKVNIECDVIAKHVARLLEKTDRAPKPSLTIDQLRDQGY